MVEWYWWQRLCGDWRKSAPGRAAWPWPQDLCWPSIYRRLSPLRCITWILIKLALGVFPCSAKVILFPFHWKSAYDLRSDLIIEAARMMLPLLESVLWICVSRRSYDLADIVRPVRHILFYVSILYCFLDRMTVFCQIGDHHHDQRVRDRPCPCRALPFFHTHFATDQSHQIFVVPMSCYN